MDSLDESALQPDPKFQSEKLIELQHEKEAIARQLQYVLKKNEQLEKSLSRQSEQYSVKDPKRRTHQLRSANIQDVEAPSNVGLNESSKAMSIASSPVRGHNPEAIDAESLKRELDKLNSVNSMLQQRADSLVIENSELRKKIGFLEKELHEAQLRLSQSSNLSMNPLIA
ncbi:MAG: hypothetical protein JST59_01325 [Actinobacteria bacterium]|nr:hypothetical protein [Actinomycetota bacterium]